MKKLVCLIPFLLSACASAIVVPLGTKISDEWSVPMYYDQMPQCKAKEIAFIIPAGETVYEKVMYLQENAKTLKADFLKINKDTFVMNIISAVAYKCEK